MALYALNATLLLPFRAWLPWPEYGGLSHFFDDQWETEVSLSHQPFFPLPFGKGQCDASLCTVTLLQGSTSAAGLYSVRFVSTGKSQGPPNSRIFQDRPK